MSSTNREYDTGAMSQNKSLFLLFELGDMSYAVSCNKIREIVPPVKLLKASGRSEYFAGFLNYRGQIVAVIDLCRLLRGQSCRMRLSTRIILIEYEDSAHESNLLGLLTQGVSEIVRKSEKEFVSSNSHSDTAPYLGGILMENTKVIQHIDLNQLVGMRL